MIEEFWIINTSGICLFHRGILSDKTNLTSKNVKIDTELFSGLLSAILSMYSEISSSQIQKLEGEEGKFLFFSKQGLIYIVRAKFSDDDKKIKKMIDVIQDLFVKKYQKELKDFDGNITSFIQFESNLVEIFKKISKPEKWGKSLMDL